MVATPVYDRTTLVDKTIRTVATNLVGRRCLGNCGVVSVSGNLRAALITALVIPLSMLFTFSGMVANHVSANLMSLGALDFGLIVDGAIVIVENSIRRLAHEQTRLGREIDPRRALCNCLRCIQRSTASAASMGADHHGGLSSHLRAIGGGRKDVPSDGFHGCDRVAGSDDSLRDLRSGGDRTLSLRQGGRKRESRSSMGKENLFACLDAAMRNKGLTVTLAVVVVILSGLLTTRMGSEFLPSLDEEDIALHAIRIPGTSLTTAIEMQNELERTIKTFPEVDRVFAKIGTAEIATDPMPPNVADIFIILKPRRNGRGRTIPRQN